MFCISCGAPLPDNAVFCPQCGVRIQKDPRASKKGAVLVACTSCGSGSLKRVQKGVYICDYCGSRFHVDDANRIESAEEVDTKLMDIFCESAKYRVKDVFQSEIRILTKGLDIAPENATLMVKLGRAYRQLGFSQKAIEYYRKAEKLNPNDPTIYTNLGSLYLTQDMPSAAKPYYEKAIAMMEADPLSASLSDIAVTYGNYALCLGKLGETRAAREYLSLAKKKGYSSESVKSICNFLRLNPDHL